MSYIDGFVAAVPTANQRAYLEHARFAAGLFREFGSTRQVECWGDDIKDGKTTDFRRAVQASADETVVFAWLEWPDKDTRDAGMARIMADERMRDRVMPFDGKRMIYGGFRPVLDDGAPLRPAGYVDGFIVPAKTARQEDYRQMAAMAGQVFRDHGVARLVEAWGDDVPGGTVTDFARAVKLEADETPCFSWCEYSDRATRDAAQAGMMADERMAQMPADLPFDGPRLVFGGFRVLMDEGTGQ